MSGLEWLINQRVQVITLDGRIIVGTLRGYDQNVNVVLVDAQERVFSMDMAVDFVPLGVQILRGDNVALVGELDAEVDAATDFNSIRVEPLPPIKH